MQLELGCGKMLKKTKLNKTVNFELRLLRVRNLKLKPLTLTLET